MGRRQGIVVDLELLEETLRHSRALVEFVQVVPLAFRLRESACDLIVVQALAQLEEVPHRQPQRIVRQGLDPGRVLVRALGLQEEVQRAIEVGPGRLKRVGLGESPLRVVALLAVAASASFEQVWVQPQKGIHVVPHPDDLADCCIQSIACGVRVLIVLPPHPREQGFHDVTQRGGLGLRNDRCKLRWPIQEIVSPPAGHGRLDERHCCRVLREGSPIVQVPLHCADVGTVVEAPVHVLQEPCLNLLWRRLSFPWHVALDDRLSLGHDAEEVRVLQPGEFAQALGAGRQVHSPLELVLLDLLGRAPLDVDKVEGPVKNQSFEGCHSLLGAFLFRPKQGQPDCVHHDVHGQSLELAELGHHSLVHAGDHDWDLETFLN